MSSPAGHIRSRSLFTLDSSEQLRAAQGCTTETLCAPAGTSPPHLTPTMILSKNSPHCSILSARPMQLLAQPVSEDAHSWWRSCCDMGSTSGHIESYTLGSVSCSTREMRRRSQRKPKPPPSCQCANSGSKPWIRESNKEEKHPLELEKSTLLS